MENFNALLTLSELKTLYSGNPVGICPLYKGSISATKVFETTGNPVVLPEYVGLEKLAIEFSPKQAGNGTPSPENVRPISGYDSLAVNVRGKNLLNDVQFQDSENMGITFTKIAPGIVHVEGTASTLVDSFVVRDVPQLPPGTTAQLPLPETVYGGTVDAVTGVGSKTWGYIASYSGESLPGEWISDRDVYSAGTTPTTGAQVAYKLATPEPFKVSQISIPSIGSENTFFTNGKNLDIIYKVSSFWG